MLKENRDEKSLQAALQLFQESIPVLTVLADINRQKIIMELATHDRLNVGQLDDRIPLSRPAISHHLKALRLAGLVDSEKSGTENYYYLTIKNTVELLKQLTGAIEDSCYLR